MVEYSNPSTVGSTLLSWSSPGAPLVDSWLSPASEFTVCCFSVSRCRSRCRCSTCSQLQARGWSLCQLGCEASCTRSSCVCWCSCVSWCVCVCVIVCVSSFVFALFAACVCFPFGCVPRFRFLLCFLVRFLVFLWISVCRLKKWAVEPKSAELYSYSCTGRAHVR